MHNIRYQFMYLVYVIILLSCKHLTEKGIQVTVKNSSSSTINEIEIGTSEKLATINYVKLNPGKEKNTLLTMKDNKTDGTYSIQYTLPDGKKENINAGYYTNGAPLEGSMFIDIKSDTTLVTFSRY
jgi:hypothetical protein